MRPIWSHVRPNFSRVRLTKIPGRTGASSHSRKEKKVSATQKLCGSTKDTPVRLISWSKPIRDSEGRTPPSDWPWSRYSCMCVCALTNASRVLLQSDREKEVSSRDACSVANLATFSAFVDPIATFCFPKKATSDKSSLSECLCDRRNGARSARFLCICSVQQASERSPFS